jgi:hypothetical protein
MRPSEVRDWVGRQHVQLRILFGEVEHACAEAIERARDARPIVERLTRAVADHLAFEDRTLVPTLRQIDGWGAVRADHVAADHALQRQQLAALCRLAREGSAIDAARAVLSLLQELRVDMDGEERDLLSPDLLRDDLIVIDQSDG